MMDFSFFGSMPKLNLIGRERTNSKSNKVRQQNVPKSNQADGETSQETKEQTNDKSKGIIAKTVERIGTLTRRGQISDENALEIKEQEKATSEDVTVSSQLDLEDIKYQGALTNEYDRDKDDNYIKDDRITKRELEAEEDVESRDKFEMQNTTFYRVLTKSFYEHNISILKPFQKRDDDSAALKSSTKRPKNTTRTLRERKLIISSPQNFQRVENEMTLILRKEAENMGLGALKKSASLDNLLGDVGGSSDEENNMRFTTMKKGRLEFSSVRDLTVGSDVKAVQDDGNKSNDDDFHAVEQSSAIVDNSNNSENEFNMKGSICANCGYDHGVPSILSTTENDGHNDVTSVKSEIFAGNRDDVLSVSADSSEEDIDRVVEEYKSNLVTMRDKSQSTPELLKSISQSPKERIEKPYENKFPLDDENVEVRRRPSIQINRISKTVDLGRRRQDTPINLNNFDIRGIVKFQLPNFTTVLTKLHEEYVAYENENFYRISDKTKAKMLLAQNIMLKSARYLNSKSKESKEVELKDMHNLSYILYFNTIKYAKQFMENEKIQVYVSDNKVTIKKTLLRFLGKRSSREILEKKGIYKNEPIFGNTLRDIYMKGAANFGSPVPMFIYRVIELIEKVENIKSLGLYRTSGNLATIQKIRFEVDNGRLEILEQFSKDPDVLTGSLKLFFRELKEPLISCEVCEKLMDVTKLDPKKLSAKDHQKIKSTLVKNLHEANLETFVVVMRHLLEVVRYKEHNKMDTYNLAVCWGPSAIFSVHGVNSTPIELSKDIVTQSHDATRLIDFLLGYYELYPAELVTLSRRPDSMTDKIFALKRQESVESSDSSKSQKKSSSNLSLSIDEIVKKLIDLIEPNLSIEGLYRKSGTPDKTNKIMKKLNKKKIGELDKYKTEVHDVTDALKKYLREQDGLVTKEIVEAVSRATGDNTQNYLEPVTRRKVTSLIEETSKKDTLIFLLRHLAKVIDHQTRQRVSKMDIVNTWTEVLNYQMKCHVSNEEFAKFLSVAMEVLNDNLPDIVRSSFNNNGSSPNRNGIMGEVVKQIKHQQERDRNSAYDNVGGEASILDDKTEQTKL